MPGDLQVYAFSCNGVQMIWLVIQHNYRQVGVDILKKIFHALSFLVFAEIGMEVFTANHIKGIPDKH